MARDFSDYNKVWWEKEESVYVSEPYDKAFSLIDVERSLREQGFEDVSSDYGSYFLALRYIANELDGRIVEFRVDEEQKRMELDLGTDLSNSREVELHHSLEEGHIDLFERYGQVYGADSVIDLLEYEIDN